MGFYPLLEQGVWGGSRDQETGGPRFSWKGENTCRLPYTNRLLHMLISRGVSRRKSASHDDCVRVSREVLPDDRVRVVRTVSHNRRIGESKDREPRCMHNDEKGNQAFHTRRRINQLLCRSTGERIMRAQNDRCVIVELHFYWCAPNTPNMYKYGHDSPERFIQFYTTIQAIIADSNLNSCSNFGSRLVVPSVMLSVLSKAIVARFDEILPWKPPLSKKSFDAPKFWHLFSI